MARNKYQQVNIPTGASAPRSAADLDKFLKEQYGGRVRVVAASEKMGKALVDLAGPVMKKAKTPKRAEQALSTAVAAWNLSLMPEAQRKESMDQMMSAVWWGLRWFMRRMITDMMQRKMKLYPEETRFIAGVEVTGERPDYKVRVKTVQQVR